jgi:serine/threonine protein kinase
VFPDFANAMSLHTFIKTILADAWEATRSSDNKSGEETGKKYVMYQIVKLTLKIIYALERMNAVGLFHGDIDPKNILLSMKSKTEFDGLGLLESFARFVNNYQKKTSDLLFSVDEINDIRIINFQTSCLRDENFALPSSTSSTSTAENRDTFVCDFLSRDYPKNGLYRDPYIDTAIAKKRKEKDFLEHDMRTQASIIDGYWSRAEIYSFGKMFYVMLDPRQLSSPTTVDVLQPLENLSPNFKYLLDRMTNKSNEARSNLGFLNVLFGQYGQLLKTSGKMK